MLIAGLAMVVGLVGAGGMSQASAQDAAAFPVQIQFFNAMTVVDDVDIYINGTQKEQRVAQEVPYGQVTDAFTGTAPATAVVIKWAATLSFDQYLYNTIIPTEAGKSYLIVITDLTLIPIEYDQSELAPDMARARAVNAAPQAPAMDIYASLAGSGTPAAGAAPIVTNLGYRDVTDGGELPAGSYDVTVTAAGTTTVAVEADGVAMDGGQAYAVVIYGKPGDTDTPLSIIAIPAPAQS